MGQRGEVSQEASPPFHTSVTSDELLSLLESSSSPDSLIVCVLSTHWCAKYSDSALLILSKTFLSGELYVLHIFSTVILTIML